MPQAGLVLPDAGDGAALPDKTVPDEPLTIVQRVYAKGEPLGGNICPPVRRSCPCMTQASRAWDLNCCDLGEWHNCACADVDHAQDAVPERVLLPQRHRHASLPARPFLQVVDAVPKGELPLALHCG